MDKKLILPTVVIVLIALTAPVLAFSDVSTTHQYSTAIEYVKNAGIVQGYPDGTYKPDANINRAEFTKIMVATFNPSIPESGNCFPDVKTDWYAKYVCLAKTNGVIAGYEDGTFKPENNIQFSEAAKIVVRAFEGNMTETGTWYEVYVNELKTKNAIPATVGTKWDKLITRGEMAYMIYKMKTYTASGSSTTGTGAIQPDINNNGNGLYDTGNGGGGGGGGGTDSGGGTGGF